ncbi:hypothetical protein D3C75_1180510 [compost metagenome]
MRAALALTSSHWVPVTGLLSPLPWMLTLSAGRPLPIRKLATVLARASDSARLLASEPMRSV